MFYYLSELREVFFGFNVLKYITFRAVMACVTTFSICVIFGPFFIRKLTELKVREIAKREDCPDLDKFLSLKQGTPTMGGLFILFSIVVAVVLWTDLHNRYVVLSLLTCVWLGLVGFFDDYLKIKRKDQKGLTRRTKLIWQIMLGFFIGSYVYFNPDTSTKLDVPFFKHLIFDLGWFYIPFVALVIVGTSNAVNLTDGLDGLAIGCILIVSGALAVLSYVTGHLNFSQYLFIPFISGAGELSIFCAAIFGASLGFLWFNSHPATIFMGDVGSLSLGGTLGVIAVFIKKELLLVIIGGVFVIEALSVIIQVTSFKLRGKRVFRMSPIHHHLQLSGWRESKIIIRFWILGIIFVLIALATLKIR